MSLFYCYKANLCWLLATSSSLGLYCAKNKNKKVYSARQRVGFKHVGAELDMGRVHPWVGSGRVGLDHKILPSWVGRVVSGPVSKISNKYAIYMQEICRL